MNVLGEEQENELTIRINLEVGELTSTLKEINRSLQQISDNLRDIKYRINPLWK